MEPCDLGQGFDEIAQGGGTRSDLAYVEGFESAELILTRAFCVCDKGLGQVCKLAVLYPSVLTQIKGLYQWPHCSIRQERFDSFDHNQTICPFLGCDTPENQRAGLRQVPDWNTSRSKVLRA